MIWWMGAVVAAQAAEPARLEVVIREGTTPQLGRLGGTDILVPTGPGTPYRILSIEDESGRRVDALTFALLVGDTALHDEMVAYRDAGRGTSRTLMLVGGGAWVLGAIRALDGYGEDGTQAATGLGLVLAGQATFLIGAGTRLTHIHRSKSVDRWFTAEGARTRVAAYNARPPG